MSAESTPDRSLPADVSDEALAKSEVLAKEGGRDSSNPAYDLVDSPSLITRRAA